jgi:hypothetical protein
MPRRLIPILLLLLPTQLSAMPAPRDFAYRASIDDAGQPLQRVLLPLEVILSLTRADLGDIAVFNAEGRTVPLALLRSPAVRSERSRELSVYEFSRFQQQHSKTVTTREQSRQADAVSELETTQTIAVKALRKDYLVELAADGDAPAYDRVDLYWTHEPAGQILELRVEIGNELDGLSLFKARKSLSGVESADRGWRSIENIPAGYRYLRLTAANDVARFDLQRVVGHYHETVAAPLLGHRQATQRIEQDGSVMYRIDYPSRVQAESMRVVPAVPGSVISGQVYASWGKSDELVPLRRDFRQHNIEGSDIRPSAPIALARRPYRSIAVSSATELDAAPAIELLYPQYELLFAADGKAPYTLAWGNFESEGAAADLGSILRDGAQRAQRDAALASLGPIEQSGGSARLAPRPGLPWKKWLLWTLLVLAVIVTARMALNLYREMNAPPST